MNITIRQARQELYKLDTIEAEKLRRDLFELENQDATLPLKFRAQYKKLTSLKKQTKDMKKQTTLEQAALNILLNRSESTEINEGIKIDWNRLSDDNIFDIIEHASEVLFEKFIESSDVFDDDSKLATLYSAFLKSFDRLKSEYNRAN